MLLFGIYKSRLMNLKKLNMTIILNEITNAKFDENVTISGILVNKDSTGLFNQVVTLTIGDEEVNVTTKAGVFQYTTLFRQLGEKNGYS